MKSASETASARAGQARTRPAIDFVFAEIPQVLADPRVQGLEARRKGVVDGDLVLCRREDLGDRMAHHACPDHGDTRIGAHGVLQPPFLALAANRSNRPFDDAAESVFAFDARALARANSPVAARIASRGGDEPVPPVRQLRLDKEDATVMPTVCL